MEYDIMKNDVIEGRIPQEKPNVRYIVGQTGSGKTSLMYKIPHDGYVMIDNDLWRGYYPNYREIIQKYHTDEVPEIMQKMKEWRHRLIQDLSAERYNLLIHTSMTNVDEINEQIQEFINNGYSISIIAIACNIYASRLRCCMRYVESILRQRVWKICK